MLLRAAGHLVNYGRGIASETKQFYKERKEAGTAVNDKPPSTDVEHLEDEDDEDDWALDDAIDEIDGRKDQEQRPPPYEVAQEEQLLNRSTDELLTLHKAHSKAFHVSSETETPLPYPVDLPQRSPKHRSRGFVRAFAPILAECKGIDQDTFLDFLDEFDAAIKVSPVWDVINAAAFFGTLGSPLVIGFPVSFAVQFASNTAKEMQRRYRTNVYLDAVNDQLFKPHGLYCMMITYKPSQSDQKVVQVDHAAIATERAARAEESAQKKGKLFMNTEAASSRGELSIPEAAPLIFPALDKAAAEEQTSSDKNPEQHPQFTSYRAYINDYLDRRRQAKFAAANPNNPLATVPDKPFASKYADPNHQMYHHGPINMVTGGRVDLWAQAREKRVQKAELEAGRPLTETEKLKAAYDRGFTTPATYVRRVIQEDVIYLVICNLPSEDESAQGTEN